MIFAKIALGVGISPILTSMTPLISVPIILNTDSFPEPGAVSITGVNELPLRCLQSDLGLEFGREFSAFLIVHNGLLIYDFFN